METKKMSLANIQGKLSRAEMKSIMAGSDGLGGYCGEQINGNASNCPPFTTAKYCDASGKGYCMDSSGTCYLMGTATCSK